MSGYIKVTKSFTTTATMDFVCETEDGASRLGQYLERPEVTQAINEDLNKAAKSVLDTWTEILKSR